MPVALGAHLPLPDRRCATAPRLGRVILQTEDGDLLRLELAAQGLVRGESRQPGADDANAHFTEPANKPCTK